MVFGCFLCHFLPGLRLLPLSIFPSLQFLPLSLLTWSALRLLPRHIWSAVTPFSYLICGCSIVWTGLRLHPLSLLTWSEVTPSVTSYLVYGCSLFHFLPGLRLLSLPLLTWSAVAPSASRLVKILDTRSCFSINLNIYSQFQKTWYEPYLYNYNIILRIEIEMTELFWWCYLAFS